MSIFNNSNKYESSNIPIVESFNNIDEYAIIRDSEYDSFKISLEFSQTIYTGIKYDDIEIVNEGFTDFFDRVVEFFKDLMKKIGDFVKKYLAYFASYFQNFKRFLEKNKEFLRSLDVSFTYEGYVYKFPKESPSTTKVNDIIGSYNIEISRADSMTYADVSAMREEFVNDTYRNKIRAAILNSGEHEITEEDFGKKSKLTFRTSEDKTTINVDKSYIDKIIKEYSTLQELLGTVTKDRDKIFKILNTIIAFFNNKASVVYKDAEKSISTSRINSKDDSVSFEDKVSIKYDTEKLKTLNAFFDLKYRESKFVSNCLTTVFMDKVNSINDCMKQQREIIRKALITKKTDSSKKDSEVK